ncbi:response regulator [Streptomyces montanisoli]|uniref:Response regulator transcription factor n=1 Tax=Streptomyces montanisoli TaxID=2798581 RepID=A0A940MBK9_9ACTN|nr:response regulator transcription factor [Streptomyces montanisoli]MBP0457967.1 response regulator transcription factor [Streptomyces montanisoli]
MSPTPISVVVADDHRVVREGLATILDAVDGVHVAGLAADGAQAVDLAVLHEAGVVLMDLHMPGTDGVEATRRLRSERPDTAVVVLTTYTDDDSVLAALEAGAIGYLTKNASATDIHRAIEAAVSGHAMLDPVAATVLINASRRDDPGHAERDAALPDGLTEREAQVLGLIAQGMSNAEIAARLYLSRATVKSHVHQIFAKTGSRDRPQAIVYAHRHGIHAEEDPGRRDG